MKVGAIVEGHGEVIAVPVLVRRVALHLGVVNVPEVLKPHRVHRQRLPKPGELERAVELMARKVGEGGKLLVLLDADDDCPAKLGPSLLARARAARADREIAVVLAKRMYEAWLLGATESLRGKRSLPPDLALDEDPEGLASPKRWLDARMARGYAETLDQAALTEAFDIEEARRVDSFDKFVRDLGRLLGVTVAAKARAPD